MHFFWILNIHFKKISYISIFITYCYEILIKLRCFLRYCPQNQIFCVPIFKIRWLLIFIIIFHRFCIQINNMTYSTSDTFFTNNNISISVNRFHFISVFFKAPCHANSGELRKRAESNSYILRDIFWKFSNTSASNNALLWIHKS